MRIMYAEPAAQKNTNKPKLQRKPQSSRGDSSRREFEIITDNSQKAAQKEMQSPTATPTTRRMDGALMILPGRPEHGPLPTFPQA